MSTPSPVVLISIDGLCPAALAVTACPNIAALRARGAATLQAASVMPSVTLPVHTSIFHSVPPERHGITTNLFQPMARPLPGLIDAAYAAGLRTASIYNWEQLRDLSSPGSLDFAYCHNECETNPESDSVIADVAIAHITHQHPDFTFAYFGTLDPAGHQYGFMSERYLAQLARIDGWLGRLLDALSERMTVLLTSDHGGHGRTHGTNLPEDMTVPWMIAGPGIRRKYEIPYPVSLLDTAPTLARILGIAPARDWEGRVVESVFA